MTQRRLAGAVLTGALLATTAAPALAAEGDPVTGWWARTVGLVPVPVTPPSPVPEGGTWVAADPSGPLAVSALRADLPAGVVATSLRLPVADAVGTPAVQACPTTDRWAPEQGGRLEGAPFADCSAPLDAVVEGEVLVVPLLPSTTGVNVLLRPAPGAVFSLTLERATAASVVTAPAPATSPLPTEPGPAPVAPLPPPAAGLPVLPALLPAVPPALGAPLPAPALAGPTAPAPVPQLAPPALPAPVTAAVRADVPDAGRASLLAAVLLAALLAVAAQLSRQPAVAPRVLGGAARLRRADTGPAAASPAPPSPSRGVGRFRSARTRPPVRL